MIEPTHRRLRWARPLTRLASILRLTPAFAPSVAIIIPVMDRAADLAKSLPCLLHQDYPNYRVILVDNSSIDGFDEVVASCRTAPSPFQRADQPGKPRQRPVPLTVVQRPRPRAFSFAVSRNCGVRCSSSDLLLFLNGDSRVEGPGTLRDAVSDFLYSFEAEADWYAEWRRRCDHPAIQPAEPVQIRSRFRRIFLHTAGSLLLMERAVFQALGGFNELMVDWGFEDTDLAGRLELAGFRRIELRGVDDLTQENARELRVQHFQVKHPEFTWKRNLRLSDVTIERFGLVSRATRTPGESDWYRIDGQLVSADALPQSTWVVERPLSPSDIHAVTDAVRASMLDAIRVGDPATHQGSDPAKADAARDLVCNLLWVGERLGRVERACLRSLVRHGHRVRLFSYNRIVNVPEGVEEADASVIIPREAIIRNADGGYALFSNWFRYRLQSLGLGLWLDTDVYCLAPILRDEPYVFASQGDGLVNSAVLQLPPQSPVLHPLLELFRQQTIPPWLAPADQAAAQERLARNGRVDLSLAPWGVAGPLALTHVLKAHGLEELALPEQVFYPVHWSKADWILDPSFDSASVVTDRTVAIHLWNERIKTFKESPAPAGSFLARLQDEGA